MLDEKKIISTSESHTTIANSSFSSSNILIELSIFCSFSLDSSNLILWIDRKDKGMTKQFIEERMQQSNFKLSSNRKFVKPAKQKERRAGGLQDLKFLLATHSVQYLIC